MASESDGDKWVIRLKGRCKGCFQVEWLLRYTLDAAAV